MKTLEVETDQDASETDPCLALAGDEILHFRQDLDEQVQNRLATSTGTEQ
jgi:hypothetical protein